MPNPKRKHTRQRRDKRRASNWRITDTQLNKCPQCGAARASHRVCKGCGFYNGELVVPKKEKKKKTEEGEKK